MRFSKVPALAILALLPTCAPAVTFHVNETADRPDDIFNGVCADGLGKCTLRAAIMEANLGNAAEGYIIELPPGTYTLTRGVTIPDDHSNGDLDVTGPISINGSGAGKTIIDANHLDRAFKVTTTGNFSLYDLTIQNGQPSPAAGRAIQGGAIRAEANVYLLRCVLDSNSADQGGAVAVTENGFIPSLYARQTTFSRNAATLKGGGFYGNHAEATFDACTFSTNTGLSGGGIAVTAGQLRMQNTTLHQNEAADDGGGIWVNNTTATIYNSTLGGNGSDANLDGIGSGGGLYDLGSTVTISNSLFANVNDNTREIDDCYTAFATVTFGGGNLLSTLAGCTYVGSALAVDPLLSAPKDNGGPTRTRMVSPSSLAVNGGPGGGCADIYGGVLTEDQRGVKRPIGTKCDLGAVELEPVGDVNGDGSVTVADVLYLINFLFAGGPAPLGRANVNGGSTIDVADVLYLINYLFAAGPAPI